jgi:hypothetical protein
VREVCFLWVVVYMVCLYILFIRVAGLVRFFRVFGLMLSFTLVSSGLLVRVVVL